MVVDVNIASVQLNLNEKRIGEFGVDVTRLLFSVIDAKANIMNNDLFVIPMKAIKVLIKLFLIVL